MKDYTSAIKSVLDRESWLDKTGDGTYEFEFYADYREELDDRTIMEILENDNPMDAMEELISDSYDDAICDVEEEIVQRTVDKLVKEMGGAERDELEQAVREYVEDNIEYILPYDHYLRQQIKTDVLLDTGDGNYDFSSNMAVERDANGEYQYSIPDEASLLWLAEQQGYSREQLLRAVNFGETDGSTFLQSVDNEMIEAPGQSLQTVTFLVEMSLADLLKINELLKKRDKDGPHYDTRLAPDCGTLTLGKDTVCGLFDFISGGGSILEVELERDVVIPIKYIYRAVPDVNSPGFYSVDAVYGMCESQWKDTVKAITPLEG